MLHAFIGENDGAHPAASLIHDRAWNLYGTTSEGGGAGCSNAGCGTVFKVAADLTEKILYAFHGGSDGAYPTAAVTRDKAGNLYGSTYKGGTHGVGTIFKLSPDGTETVLYAFRGKLDGAYPAARLIQDKTGNLYGTTSEGGAYMAGTVFRLRADGTLSVLHAFGKHQHDGSSPYSGLIKGTDDKLYGTTSKGGAHGEGTVFAVRK